MADESANSTSVLQEAEAVSLLSAGAEGIEKWNQIVKDGAIQIPALKSANLAHLDLSGANLEPTRLPLASLAGTNLTGAKYPSSIDIAAELKNVEEASKNCRTLFLTMLGACFYCMLVVGETTDGNLLWGDKSSVLPIIQTPIPIAGFYYVAPLILIGFYIYLHLYLYRLWQRVASLPAVLRDGQRIDQSTYPWLLGGLIGKHAPLLRNSSVAYGSLQNATSILLAWVLGPITIWYMWGRAVAAHDVAMTFLNVCVFTAAVGLGVDFYHSTIATLRSEKRRKRWWSVSAATLAALVTGLLSYQPVFWWDAPHLSQVYKLPLKKALGYHPFAEPMIRLNKDADLRGTRHTDRHLRHSSLSRFDLTGADLSGSILVGSDFTDAILKDVNLTGTNLTAVVGLTMEQLDLACGKGKIMVTLRDPTRPAMEFYRLKQRCPRKRQEEVRQKQREAEQKAEQARLAAAAEKERLEQEAEAAAELARKAEQAARAEQARVEESKAQTKILTDVECRKSSLCSNAGMCTARNGHCIVASDADCQTSEICSREGRCTLRDGKCIVASNVDCRMSEYCSSYGNCTFRDGHCIATSDADCHMSDVCSREGMCTLRDGKCIVASDADCHTSEICSKEGRCTLRDGKCIVASDDDCLNSIRCIKYDKCTARYGKCEVIK